MAWKVGDHVVIKGDEDDEMFSAYVLDPMPGESWVAARGFNLGVKMPKSLDGLIKNVVRIRENRILEDFSQYGHENTPCCNVHGKRLVRGTGKRRLFYACPKPACDVGWWSKDAYKIPSYPADQLTRTARLELCKITSQVSLSKRIRQVIGVVLTDGTLGRLNLKECKDLTRVSRRPGIMRFDDHAGNCWRLSTLEGDTIGKIIGFNLMPGYCPGHVFDPVTDWCGPVTDWCGFCGTAKSLIFGNGNAPTSKASQPALHISRPTVWREIDL